MPKETVRLLDHHSERGERSHLIDEAVRFYLREIERAHIRRQLKAGALARSGRDVRLTSEWFRVEHNVL